MIGKQGKRFVSIPLPQIELPRFRFGKNQKQGVGQGEGDEGEAAPGQEGEGQGQAGEDAGKHVLEVDVSLEDLAKILGEELELPNIEPRGQQERADAGRPLHRHQPQSGRELVRHFKRTFKPGAEAPDRVGHLRPRRPGHRADPRGHALPLGADAQASRRPAPPSST